jgi:hypothetical protein
MLVTGVPRFLFDMLDDFVKEMDFSSTFRVNKLHAQTLFHVASSWPILFLPGEQSDEG